MKNQHTSTSTQRHSHRGLSITYQTIKYTDKNGLKRNKTIIHWHMNKYNNTPKVKEVE